MRRIVLDLFEQRTQMILLKGGQTTGDFIVRFCVVAPPFLQCSLWHSWQLFLWACSSDGRLRDECTAAGNPYSTLCGVPQHGFKVYMCELDKSLRAMIKHFDTLFLFLRVIVVPNFLQKQERNKFSITNYKIFLYYFLYFLFFFFIIFFFFFFFLLLLLLLFFVVVLSYLLLPPPPPYKTKQNKIKK